LSADNSARSGIRDWINSRSLAVVETLLWINGQHFRAKND
jgi:hypothetical protein